MTITILFPAHAGVILAAKHWDVDTLPFLRTRGGDPEHWSTSPRWTRFSPHTRG